VVPLLAVWLWRYRPVRGLVPVAGWIIAVGCCAHALIDMTGDLLALTGTHPIQYPAGFWLSIDRRAAAFQDLFFNEPWFFIEGFLWGLFAMLAVRPPSRRWWRRSAALGCALARSWAC
jgi:hypothetical protein